MPIYTLEEIREIIEIEGFEGALTSYLSADNIENEALAGFVRKFASLHETIEETVFDSEDEELIGTVTDEGLDYTLAEYYDPEDIEDSDVADLVYDYLELRRQIEIALKE